MLRDHVAISQEVVSYDCPKCLSGGACFVGMFVNGFRPMSRREQRRKRKAAKNLVMYKTFGRRPWGIADDVLSWPSAYNWTPAKVRHLREPSGFKAMSRRAEQVAFETAWLREQLAEFNRLSMSTLFDEVTP